MNRLTREGTAEPVSRNQILRRERGQGNFHVSCSADHVQDWQPYPVDPYSCYMCDHTCYTYMYKTKKQFKKISKDHERVHESLQASSGPRKYVFPIQMERSCKGYMHGGRLEFAP